MKTVSIALVVSLLFLPCTAFAAPPSGPSTNDALRIPQVADSGYSLRARNTYFYTGIGTLAAGAAFVAAGADESSSDHVTSKSAGPALYVIGGTFLAASAVLWTLYFREKSKEPVTSVGLELEKGKAVVLARYRF